MEKRKDDHVETQNAKQDMLESKDSSDEKSSSTIAAAAKNTSADNPTQHRDQVIEALKQVIDPEIHINIVDLGLVYRVDVSKDFKRVVVDFTLTTPGCPLADEIEENISKMCRTVFPSAEIETNLVWVPMWSADFMSEDARLELGFPI